MPATIADAPLRSGGGKSRLRFAIAVLAMQALAAIFFIADSLVDWGSGDSSAEVSALEFGMAVALLAGIVLGFRLVQRLLDEARQRERLVAVAKGALADVIDERFEEWSLSAAERDVALFALKGCSIAEIAALRGAAAGTVRAQLSQVYAKAGVSSQPMFVALFVEELLGD